MPIILLINQITLFHNYIINLDLSTEKKSNILCKLADIDQNLIKGCDEYIQFMKLIYHIIKYSIYIINYNFYILKQCEMQNHQNKKINY